jgi:amidase
MQSTSSVSIAESRAFVETFQLRPTKSGPLDGLSFAVKDLIDIAGHKTGCGNPSWRDTHPAATAHAVCVELALAAGARCVGKTVTDELAFSLVGENHFYGTPLNPKAPDRVPGGSSSGSASAVACGLADFALGTDTGGSVRVPASNCGIWGLRPSHGVISVAGVNPFAPSFDTVGLFGRTADVLARAAAALLACEVPTNVRPTRVHLIREAFARADPEIQAALATPLQLLRDHFGDRFRETSLAEIDGESAGSGFQTWFETFYILQWAEIESCLGPWITAMKPAFGPFTASSFKLARELDRGRIAPAWQRREKYSRRLQTFLGPTDLLCLPTSPALAPRKGTVFRRDEGDRDYYPRSLSLTSLAGVGRLPQVSMPVAARGGVPVGLSLLATYRQDAFLLAAVQSLAALMGLSPN